MNPTLSLSVVSNKIETAGTSRMAVTVSENAEASNYITLLNIHEDAFQEIMSFLTFDEIARLRQVSKFFNETCQKILNKGFLSVQRYHSRCLKDVKSKVPRRESERRAHPLARHIDVLTGIETRLSLLSMTFYKYIVLGVFCFIPGKVLDECYRVLREVVVHKNLPKSFELLQELRDISSMAMEHFEEHIVPTLKKNVALSSSVRSGRFLRCLPDPEDSDSEMQASSSVTACTYQSVTTPLQRLALSRSMTERPASSNLKLEFTVQQNRILINNQQRKIVDLTSKLLEYGRKINEQERLLSEYGRKIIQLEQKFNDCSNTSGTSSNKSSPESEETVSRKRPAPGNETEDAVKEETSRKRPLIATVKRNAASFRMALRNRKH